MFQNKCYLAHPGNYLVLIPIDLANKYIKISGIYRIVKKTYEKIFEVYHIENKQTWITPKIVKAGKFLEVCISEIRGSHVLRPRYLHTGHPVIDLLTRKVLEAIQVRHLHRSLRKVDEILNRFTTLYDFKSKTIRREACRCHI